MRHLDPNQMLDPDLDAMERRLLRAGIVAWGGPARCTEEMAIAMGFDSVQDLFDSTDRLAGAITAGAALTAADWLRVLLATEIVFASDTIGSGHDWAITTGLSDTESLAALRNVQRKLAGIGNVLGSAFGTRSRRP